MFKRMIKSAGIALGAAVITVPMFVGSATAAPTQTANLVAYIQSSQGNASLAGSFSYYDHGWKPMPMYNSMTGRVALPVGQSVPVRATYEGTSDQKTVTIGATGTGVWFHTSMVNVMVQSHTNGVLDLADGSASYYARGWHKMTGVNPNNPAIRQTEMLPGNYSFAATYNGTRDQKVQTIVERNVYDHNNATNNANQTVYFHAARVNIALQSLDCAGHVSGFVYGQGQSYYARGWNSVTTPNANNPRMVTAEMLPGTYWFAARTSDPSVQGARYQKQATIVEPNPNNHANATQSVYFSFAAAQCPA